MRARCRRSLVWSSPLLLMLGLLVLGGPRRAAADEMRWVADDACADLEATAEVADFLAFAETQGGAEAQATPAAPAAQAAPAAPAEPEKGGKACTTNAQCPKKSYCAKAAGDCRGKGECKVKPEICTDEWKPVCGCDGKTYSNACWAAVAGVNVKAEGECPKIIRCKTNKQCPKGDFCAKPDGKCEDEGLCVKRPVVCPALVVDPVCGCNGKTYGNRCEAFRAGTAIKHTGKCEKPQKSP